MVFFKQFTEPIKESSNKNVKKPKLESTNLNFPMDMDVDNVIELTLRDYVLDLEDKVKIGCLGFLKVIDRDSWRKSIQEGNYDKQCDRLVYGSTEIEVDVAAVHSTLDKIKHESRNSRPNTPDSEVGSVGTKTYRDPGKYLGSPGEDEMHPDAKQQMAIRQMACAILQVRNYYFISLKNLSDNILTYCRLYLDNFFLSFVLYEKK